MCSRVRRNVISSRHNMNSDFDSLLFAASNFSFLLIPRNSPSMLPSLRIWIRIIHRPRRSIALVSMTDDQRASSIDSRLRLIVLVNLWIISAHNARHDTHRVKNIEHRSSVSSILGRCALILATVKWFENNHIARTSGKFENSQPLRIVPLWKRETYFRVRGQMRIRKYVSALLI